MARSRVELFEQIRRDRREEKLSIRRVTLLTDELNTTPPRLPGDPRPITHQITEA